MKTSFLLTTLACIGSALALPFDGDQVLRIQTETDEAAASLKKVVKNLRLDTWLSPTKGGFADILVPAAQRSAFKKAMTGFQMEPMITNVSAAILNSAVGSAPSISTFSSPAAVPDSWFDSYHSYADHQSYLSSLVSTYPSSSRLVSTGTSYEGRNITGIHIFNPSTGPGKNPAVIYHGTVHAREWITAPVLEYVMVQLLNATADAATKQLTSKYDFYIFPFVNPDGFVYTQSSSNNRLWRKNRQPGPSGSSCRGTDINRNWPSHWDVAGGSSTDPCDETYRGTSAGSTPENKGLTAFMLKIQNQQGVHQYMDTHSYSQLYMFPYGWTCDVTVANADSYRMGAATFKKTVAAVYGTSYTTGAICPTIYQTSGGSTDWAQDVAKIPYAWAIELRDTGKYGFLLPANQIRPSGIETWAGLKAVLLGGT